MKKGSPRNRTIFGSLLTAFRNREGTILPFFGHRVTNACTESANNRNRAVRRMEKVSGSSPVLGDDKFRPFL
ncbi:MAG: transposase [Nitrospirae bacterium]|nr:MAG: Transposase [Leptospirillum sp. Group IV 'UBA BS']MCL4486353.1 transposase [Nitrospirota bacterium]MCL5285487.1 transposase [Nitrospirota bacterium]